MKPVFENFLNSAEIIQLVFVDFLSSGKYSAVLSHAGSVLAHQAIKAATITGTKYEDIALDVYGDIVPSQNILPCYLSFLSPPALVH